MRDVLQRPLATAGYIHQHAKLDTERRDLIDLDKALRPLDVSFDIGTPTAANAAAYTCEYTTIGADVTISFAPTRKIPNVANVKNIVTAIAEQHLQQRERGKLVRNKEDNPITHASITGEQVIGNLIRKGTVLIPAAICPHGAWGPMFENFLFHYQPAQPLKIDPLTTPNAYTMHQMATTSPCPLGIIHTANAVWKRTRQRRFYGNSYTAPTPKEYTLGELGLGITKALASHLKKAEQHFGTHPKKRTVVNGSPPGIRHPSESGLFGDSTSD